ncbi:MAG TPA: CusA/CzcA family heavy metal efflux RND transporter [Nitrospiraceae bacterium]|nr:CusA/CzcA family heavy metal efflux RND transporter [Nitrospiraceae bacterium]
MVPHVVEFALVHRTMVAVFGALLLCGGLYAFHLLDIVAYPDPSPPMVEVITQNPALSSEEIERQITLPIEFALAAMPGLSHTRSISLFGLSDIKFYFDYNTEYFRDRQEVLSRLAFLGLPAGVQPAISPWWALAEVYRYEVVGPDYTLTDLKTIEDWQLNREFKRVHGVIDVTAFGGTTKQYHVELDPGLLFSYGISTPQVMSAISGSNANAGGNYLTVGSQSFDIRGVGLIRDLDDIENIMVAEKDGTPILIKNLGTVKPGYRVRLGKVGIDDRDDVVEGVVLVMRGYQSLPVLDQVKHKIDELNGGKLPEGVQIKPVYDRSVLIHTTIETVMDILLTGISFVFVTLFLFLGHFRTAVIVALAVPAALLFTFILMVAAGESANLVSLGAIDFGIIVDSTLLMVENVFYQLTHKRDAQASINDHIVRASHDVGRPIFFATAIIIVAFVPLFTMKGVPGKIFAPMSLTYGFALTGALMMAFTVAPVLCSWLLKAPLPEKDTRLVEWIRRHYLRILSWALDHHTVVILFAVLLLAGALGLWFILGGEFMPPLEEGNIWLRATMPIGISFEEASRLVTDMRTVFRKYPESRTVVSQLGRPDDGTDPTSFFNAEFLVDLKPAKEWRAEIQNKAELIGQIEQELSKTFPGVTLNFSQMIQDNVEEAMTGVKGENSVKVFGPDLSILEDKANQIKAIMDDVVGVKDLGVLRSLGQPNLLIEVDRSATARYGIEVDDVNAVVQAAVGGQSVTQVFEGEKWFDLVVRFLPEFRKTTERIGNIQVITPGKSRIPLKQLATIKESVGPFMIYRENNQRYVPVKFSVRGRDLERTVKEAEQRIAQQVELPKGYRLEWHGEYSQLQAEKHRLATIVPLSLFIILLIVSYALQSLRDGLLVLAAVPFALVGGIIALFVTGTHFSISAAVGFLSVFGVAIQGALVDISRLHEYFEKGFDLKTAILKNAEVRMRPVMMTTLSAAIGLIPASVATGIGAQSQQPLARVVVGGMLSSVTLILIVLPVLYQWAHRREHHSTMDRTAHGTVES